MMNMVSAIALFIGGLCWVASLWFPVFITDSGHQIIGYWVLLTGWMGVTLFNFAWLANLLIIIAALTMYRYPIRATIVAAIALLSATQAFFFGEIPGQLENSQIIDFGLGFWLWYSSILLVGSGVVLGADDEEPSGDIVSIEKPIELEKEEYSESPFAKKESDHTKSPFMSKETTVLAANDDAVKT